MSQLIALVIAILLGAIVTAVGYVFLGGAFAEQSVKAEAQKILTQAEQIEAAMIAYKLDHNGTITLGDSSDLTNNNIFIHLINGGYLKHNINESIEEGQLSWHLSGDGGDGVCDEGDNCTIQRVVSDSEQCIHANYLRNRYPEEGLEVGNILPNGHVVQTGEISSEGIPLCNDGTTGILGSACWVTL